MLKFFANCFECVCSILAVLNFIILGSFGGYFGYYIGDSVLHDNPIFYAVLIAFVGLAVAFFVNVLSFGLISQIIEIRHNTETIASLNSKLHDISDSVSKIKNMYHTTNANELNNIASETKNSEAIKSHDPKLESICKTIPGIEI